MDEFKDFFYIISPGKKWYFLIVFSSVTLSKKKESVNVGAVKCRHVCVYMD